VAFGEVVVLSVPWALIDEALRQAGSMAGKIVIDTCNQFGRGSELIPRSMTAVRYNQNRIPGARLTKAYNTLTAGFQHRTSGLTGPERVAMFFCADDPEARQIVEQLIDDSGFVPIYVGGLDDATPMEAPRRPGAVYGEEYHEDSAKEFLANYRK
jgi:predicted dinucleotide-binding enzyme